MVDWSHLLRNARTEESQARVMRQILTTLLDKVTTGANFSPAVAAQVSRDATEAFIALDPCGVLQAETASAIITCHYLAQESLRRAAMSDSEADAAHWRRDAKGLQDFGRREWKVLRDLQEKQNDGLSFAGLAAEPVPLRGAPPAAAMQPRPSKPPLTPRRTGRNHLRLV